MFKSVDLFQTSAAMAHHAGQRQAVVARNIANADTPGFRSAHIAPFSESYNQQNGPALKATRPGHVSNVDTPSSAARVVPSTAEPAPNGNTVSIEDEMLEAVSVSREHSRALAIYRHAMTVIRTSLGK